MAQVGFTNTCIVFVVDLDLVMVLYEPRREQMGLRTFANSKASGEPTIRAVSSEALLFAYVRRPIFSRRSSII